MYTVNKKDTKIVSQYFLEGYEVLSVKIYE